MDEKQKERLFGEIGIDLGYLTKADVENSLELQKNDEVAGTRKCIGAYLSESGKLNPEQVEEILKIQTMAVRMTPHLIDNS
jgi:hypothetical protein